MALFKTRRMILAGYSLSVLMVFFFAFYANRDLRKVRRESGEAEDIIYALSNLEKILDDLQDIETGQRGYLLSGDSAFLAPYFGGLERLQSDTLAIRRLTTLFPARSGELEDLLRLVNAKVDFVRETVEEREARGFDSSLSIFLSGVGKRLMDSVRQNIHHIEEEQRLDLASETDQRRDAARSTSRLFNLMAAAFFIFLSLLFWYSLNNLRATERYETRVTYLAGLVENTNDAIMSIDERGMIISWNRAAEKLFGYSREEVRGKYAPDLLKSNYNTETLAALRRELVSHGVLNSEVLLSNRTGNPVYCLVSTTPLRNARRKLYGFVSVMKDIGERKKLEEQLKLFNRELARQVEEKTGDLLKTNEQLANTNRDLEQFAYIASHDLQEPLRSVRSFLLLLEKKYAGHLDDQGRLYIKEAVDGAVRMKELITGLLSFSRVGRQGLKSATVDLDRVAEQVIQSMEPAVRESGARIRKMPLPRVKGDATLLGQVIQNLLGNAIKYRRMSEPPVIEINVQETKDQYEFEVKDNGIGFDSEHWDSIFNVFYRLHTPNEYPGTGIGLAICKKIIELHSGRVWVRSARGKGSSFFFSLPKAAVTDSDKR